MTDKKIAAILGGLNGKMRKGTLDSAYNLLMDRQHIDALDEPYLLFGALMVEILTLQNRVEKLEGKTDG